MLKRPSVVVPLHRPRPVVNAMEVESTRVETLSDGKKLIDVTMRRAQPGGNRPPSRGSGKLVVPQFDADEVDSSSSSDDDENGRRPQNESPVKPARDRHEKGGEENNNNETTSFQGDFQWTGVQDIQALTHANAALTGQVTELKAQLKTLQIQLEALAPVPGLNASVVHDILLDKDGSEHDIRDTKIVHQAKTLRHLKRSLQRDKQLAVNVVKQCKALESHAAALEKENETLKLQLARFKARASVQDHPLQSAGESVNAEAATTTTPAQTKDSLSAYKKKFEDMRIKHDKLLADLKKTQRALLREVGEDGLSLDEIVDGVGTTGGVEQARRGRAQQIIMLKAKIKKLEQDALTKVSSSSLSFETTITTGTGGVDQRAIQDLSVQHAQKQRFVDKLTSEHGELLERYQQLTTKWDGAKSRMQILEKEKHDHKAKLQVLIDKSRNDDALVDALQRQLKTWKGKLHEAKRARTAESSSVGSGGSGGLPKDERMELDCLRALVADYKQQQQRQLATSQSSSSSAMPPPSEPAQYRAITIEKERLQEQVKVLQAQMEDRERQIRTLKSSGDQSLVSRIPRLGSGALPAPTSQYIPTPPAPTAVAVDTEAQKKHFRDAMASKEHEIESLQQQLQRLTQQQQQQQHLLPNDQEVLDLQEENAYLRQEFDRLKTRYEAVLKSTRKPTT